MKKHVCDYLIIGSGLAGLASALKLADDAKVIILTKEKAEFSNTSWAQGGIASVMSSEDSFENHVRDTLEAGAGLCKVTTVENIVTQAPDRIQDLINWGVVFDHKGSAVNNSVEIDLTREGGHSFRRILHVEDHTGANIHQTLLSKAQSHPNIQILENFFAIDLLMSQQMNPEVLGPGRCVGTYALEKTSGLVHAFIAKDTLLSTGGAGKVYLYTTNWSGATGDGIAMAYRAGARIANLEFMQFHPTCLYHKDSRNFLISEALRGEGGELVDQNGQAFMKKYHPLGSLAPRDIVARSIDAEMKKSGASCVYLDVSRIPAEKIKQHFPSIYARCLQLGIDITKQSIPVVPAAHYLCGGVVTDVNGKTDVPGLWALGETACTGLHGANRLASNSLLECLAMAQNATDILKKNQENIPFQNMEPREWKYSHSLDSDEMIVIHHMWDEIRTLMWNYVGIVRSNKRLLRAQSRLKNILSEVIEYYSNFSMHSDILELRNIAIVADLTVECALRRKESRGIHYSLDYPPSSSKGQSESSPQDTILVRAQR